jgi:aminocarboxymuconate-semialdehyde decarboxylase
MPSAPPRADIHSHFYPAEYLEVLARTAGEIRLQTEPSGRRVFCRGEAKVAALNPPALDPGLRLPAMDAAGVDVQVLSLTFPSINFLPPREGAELARVANDALAAVVNGSAGRFAALAAVPQKDAALATAELTRAVEQLGLRGAIVFTNIDGVYLDDPSQRPLLERATALGAPLLLHPMAPPSAVGMADYWLTPILGMEFEVMLALGRLIFTGALERLPGLCLVASHLGGGLPFLQGRMDHGYHVHPDCRQHIGRPPSTYLRQVYYDAVAFHPPALRCAIESVGADRLVLGSDYPPAMGDLAGTVQAIEALDLPGAERVAILRRAGELLGLAS